MSGRVTISAASKKHIVYHRPECIYVCRMKYENRMEIPLKQALNGREYCSCKYCGGLAGNLRVRRDQVDEWRRNLSVDFTYVKGKNRLFLRTDAGFWKVVPDDDRWTYQLYHLNRFSEKKTTEKMMQEAFHRQGDVAVTHSLNKLVNYVHLHDDAKKIIADDYHKLPRSTKRQKKYYAQAERRAHRNNLRRMDAIFNQIEAEMKRKETDSAGIFIG